jgi:hypothetical protein
MEQCSITNREASLILVQTETIPEIPLMSILPFFAFVTVFSATLLRRKRFVNLFTFETLEELQQPYIPTHKSLPNKHQLQVKKNGS